MQAKAINVEAHSVPAKHKYFMPESSAVLFSLPFLMEWWNVSVDMKTFEFDTSINKHIGRKYFISGRAKMYSQQPHRLALTPR